MQISEFKAYEFRLLHKRIEKLKGSIISNCLTNFDKSDINFSKVDSIHKALKDFMSDYEIVLSKGSIDLSKISKVKDDIISLLEDWRSELVAIFNLYQRLLPINLDLYIELRSEFVALLNVASKLRNDLDMYLDLLIGSLNIYISHVNMRICLAIDENYSNKNLVDEYNFLYLLSLERFEFSINEKLLLSDLLTKLKEYYSRRNSEAYYPFLENKERKDLNEVIELLREKIFELLKIQILKETNNHATNKV